MCVQIPSRNGKRRALKLRVWRTDVIRRALILHSAKESDCALLAAFFFFPPLGMYSAPAAPQRSAMSSRGMAASKHGQPWNTCSASFAVSEQGLSLTFFKAIIIKPKTPFLRLAYTTLASWGGCNHIFMYGAYSAKYFYNNIVHSHIKLFVVPVLATPTSHVRPWQPQMLIYSVAAQDPPVFVCDFSAEVNQKPYYYVSGFPATIH